jgi:pseudouridine synthase
MTNDGDLANLVTHPRYGIEKIYHVMTPVRATPAHINALLQGVELEDGPARAIRARIVSAHRERSIVEAVMTEGRKREVRRLFDAVDLPVDQLVRTSIAGISDRTLTPGSHRELTVDEVRSIYALAAVPSDGSDDDGGGNTE